MPGIAEVVRNRNAEQVASDEQAVWIDGVEGDRGDSSADTRFGDFGETRSQFGELVRRLGRPGSASGRGVFLIDWPGFSAWDCAGAVFCGDARIFWGSATGAAAATATEDAVEEVQETVVENVAGNDPEMDALDAKNEEDSVTKGSGEEE